MRVIGILIYKGKDSVLKNLKPGWYPFGNYQCPTSMNGWQWMTGEQKKADEYCNKLYKSVAGDESFAENMVITVNSIVGTNGSGKTTLLEIFIRIINNFSYYLFDKGWIETGPKKNPQLGHELHEALGFSATLYFETDGCLGGINCDEHEISYAYWNKNIKKIKLPVQKYLTTERIKSLLKPFFYTICSNYSIYSYNETRYGTFVNQGEEDNHDWISGIMHKNDGYLAPIVMVPYREDEGHINVNKEITLAKQRLSTLALLFLSQKKPFMADYKPVKLEYRYRYEAKGIYEHNLNRLIDNKLLSKGDVIKEQLKIAWLDWLMATEGFNSKPKAVQETILMYLLYKTVKICLNYRNYGVMLGLRKASKDEIKTADNQSKSKELMVADLPENFARNVVGNIMLEKEPSHITLKVQQMIEYIKRGFYKAKDKEEIIKENNALGIYDVGDLKAFLDMNLRYDNDHKFHEKPKSKYESYDDVFLLMPPAIFEWEMSFTKKGDKDGKHITLDRMSSGEKQMMQSFSYILYHIKNLQSVKENGLYIPYHHVNLIFDEAELYYHPEFQRDFVKNLIQMLAWCHIDGRKIRSINLTIVTHSPFVLSDVMIDQTLNMKGGVVMDKHKQTFGANIHNLLYDQFINDSIGAAVRKAIDTIVDLYQHIDKEVNKEKLLGNYPYYEFLASSIAEPYLRNNLLSMLEDANMKAERAKLKHHELLEKMMEKEVRLSRELEGVRQQIESLKEEKDEEN